MSNSPLVSYIKLSPNNSGKRTHAIDTITIHCVVGHCSLRTLGEVFAPTSRQASCNYGVDDNGNVGMYVEECNRSWCTSSNANDQRSVTIEVASDTTTPYKVTDGALAGVIKLCADICRRNGIKKLVWSTDKNTRLNHLNGCNMTVHRDYANKSCPGDYLYGKHSYIADEVNRRLGGGVIAPSEPTTSTPPTATTGDEAIWKFLIGKGLNAFAAAGIMGNLYAESGLRSNNLQNNYEKSLGYTDETYTSAVDSGKYANFVKDSAGYGLAQWTYYTRKQALLDFARAAKSSIGDLTMQLNFLWKELQDYGLVKTLAAATSVLSASNVILLQFEKPADQSVSVQSKRAGYGQGYYDKYASKTAPPNPPAAFVPYTVRVTASELNIRKGAGTGYAVVGAIKDKGVYTIVEEADGAGAKKWGKLKSGAGWISLDFTQR